MVTASLKVIVFSNSYIINMLVEHSIRHGIHAFIVWS
ncbi:hypothetical protein BMMGA3_15645 [Bacillus methanolicus MGA3]|uniref:Uncharacterized protein n=1 Tax=Bacillus methanolicus (strain MGA3 / ATCC 53907) TaxID=796606 RepID=A0A068M132_BACMM|nr:hypothetical protein BMMGA3_15645 [Bacillus methanolicus MGA3]